ncbi:MAG: hypothetical protein KBB16_02030 [Candidatus Pacebacteria bacterium]|nr:hypothetical protein [Candidatus Paceibacterota bacterium]
MNSKDSKGKNRKPAGKGTRSCGNSSEIMRRAEEKTRRVLGMMGIRIPKTATVRNY